MACRTRRMSSPPSCERQQVFSVTRRSQKNTRGTAYGTEESIKKSASILVSRPVKFDDCEARNERGLPKQHLRTRTFVTLSLQLCDRFAQCTLDRRDRLNVVIVRHQAKDELFARACRIVRRGVEGKGESVGVVLGRVGVKDRLEKVGARAERASQRTSDRRDGFLAELQESQGVSLIRPKNRNEQELTMLFVAKPYGTRRVVGRKPQRPQKEEGIRMLPPMSVPTPKIEPFVRMRAPSPPLEPPGVSERFNGLRVRPKTWLSVSEICIGQTTSQSA